MSTEIEPTQPAQVHVPLVGELNDLDQAMRYAKVMAMADILPQDLRNKPANVLMIVLYGQQLKVPPVVAIQTISVVKGRPVMSGKLLLSRVREAGHQASILEHTDTKCTVQIKRGDTGEEHTETFTLDDAVNANLVKVKDGKPFARSAKGEPLPWETWTKRMLLWRAAGFCADFICPEVRMGFAIEGELEVADDRPSLAQVAAEREDKPKTAEKVDPPVPADDDEVAAIVAEIEAEHGPGEADAVQQSLESVWPEVNQPGNGHVVSD